MQIEHPSKTLTEALGAALYQDLGVIRYRRWTPGMKAEGIEPENAPNAERRPNYDDVEVYMFKETWGSTALGYGGIGGAAMTPAYTVIVVSPSTFEACVYWGCGRLGYNLDLLDEKELSIFNEMLQRKSSTKVSQLRKDEMREKARKE